MIRRRLCKHVTSDQNVSIVFYGPKSILPTKAIVEVDKSMTWLDVITDYLGIKDAEEKGMIVCTWKFVVTNPSQSEGWTCQLNETVSSFVSKFQLKKPQYTVKIWMPRNSSKKKISKGNLSSRTQVVSSQVGTEQLHDLSSYPEPMSLTAETDEATSEQVCETVSVKTEVDMIENDSMPDMMSRNFPRSSVSNVNTQYCWAYSEKKVLVLPDKCLRRNLKVIATKKVSGVSESTFHRLKHEIAKLNSMKKFWEKMEKKTPLVCWYLNYFMKENPRIVNGIDMAIFKDLGMDKS